MRIIYWNIQNFSVTKSSDGDIFKVIAEVFFPPELAGGAAADIFVIVEVVARNTNLGEVPVGSGADGLCVLAQAVHAWNHDFVCIPPISLATGGGQAEAIGVIYNSSVVTFLGPMVWSNLGPVPANQLGRDEATADQPWNQLLAPGQQFVAAVYPEPWSTQAQFHGPGALAPQIGFPNAGPPHAFLEFPAAGRRRPLRFQFSYNGGANGLDLWAVHLPPYVNPAAAALGQLATSPDIVAAPPPNAMRIVFGDFNLNTANAYQLGRYAPMTALGYRLLIGGVGPGLQAGTATMFKHPCGWQDYMNGLSLDNALVWAGAGMAVTGIEVIDLVAGRPTPPFTGQMNTPLAAYPVMAGNPTQVFRAWSNYGHIGNRPATGNMVGRRGASDHLPLAIYF